MSQVLPLLVSVFAVVFVFVSVFVFVFGLSKNVRFEGSLRPDSSVTSLLRTQEKLLRTGRGGMDGNKALQDVLADLKKKLQPPLRSPHGEIALLK